MPAPQDHLLKSLTDDMARLLSGSGGESAVLLMERFGLLSIPEKKPSGDPPGLIGVWEAGPQGYERSEALRDEWLHWADVQSIPPKGERKRVLLLGDSVARGFLYDPDFNPAKALEAALPTALGQPVEVVDLAKINLMGPQLTGLIDTAPAALEPDVLVVFAGNNWSQPGKRDRHLDAAVLREQGALGLKSQRERRLAAFVGTLRRQLTELSARLPIVLVIPEINLADWRLDANADAPWLPPGRNRRWLECRTAARSALAARRLDEAAALAHEMVDLDGGTAASGWTILADCARATGDLATARMCLGKACDARLWDFTRQTPKTYSVIQQALRGCALPGKIAVVDLPSCFATWQAGELPGRRLFLDYCHLSAEGIRVSMAATALEVANLLDAGRPLPGIESLANDIPPPSPRIEATAHFAGALHSSYWGQSSSFISYLCQEAARRSPEVAQAMRVYLEVQVRRAPTWACKACESLSAVATPFLERYIVGIPKLFQPVLLPAIADALENNGLPCLRFLEELRNGERSLSSRPLNLLDPYHRPSLSDLDWHEWPSQFRRAYSPTSRFPWVSRAPGEVAFVLNCRRMGAIDPGECQVRINGTCVIRLPLTREWSTLRFSAPGNLVQSGVNWLEIDWPIDLPAGEEEIEHIAREDEHGRIVPLLPLFAEISLLTAVQR
jgi:hypothetical protein